MIGVMFLIEVAIPIIIVVAIMTVIPISLQLLAGIRTHTTIILSISLMLLECDTIAFFAFVSLGWLDLGLIN